MKLKNNQNNLSLIILLVFFLWYLVFRSEYFNFWLRLTSVVFILSLIAISNLDLDLSLELKDIYLGLAFAVILYLIFYLGREISSLILPFSLDNIMKVYQYRQELDPIYISLLLLFIIGPGEELFWRAYIQEEMIDRLGLRQGYLLTALLYSLIHLWTENIILILAALVAGLFWGALFLKYKKIVPIIISHAVWDLLVFILFPLG